MIRNLKSPVQANSREVVSQQVAPHPRLDEIVERHRAWPFLRAPSEAGRRAFAEFVKTLDDRPLILDAGSGTGVSTLRLAHMFPDSRVIGVDQSPARLAIGLRALDRSGAPVNAMLLRCELVDFWQLAAQANLRLARQCLLYPNPWPKAAQVQRRWHAHPIFPTIIALGGTLELRTNWRVYAQEFAQALGSFGYPISAVELTPEFPLTPFENKYANSGHALWRCETAL